MRVSKVKVDKEMVLMHRNNKEGALIIGNSTDNKTNYILPKKKKENFYKSIINKTLVKDIKFIDEYKKTRTKPRDRDIELTLTNLIEKNNAHPLKNKDIETINKNLRGKFNKYLSYNGNEPFNLAELIYEYSTKNDIKIPQPYKDWVEWYIETKSKFLIKSIENNRIVIENGEEKLSKRKKVLIGFEEKLKEKGEIDLSDVANKFNITSLVKEISPKVEEYIEKDKKRTYKDKNNNKLERELNFAIKDTLQEHQKGIFGTRENPKERDNDKLSIYNLEVVKYIEHYFPIKKSQRTYNIGSIKHHISEETIKSTIQHQIENAVRLNMIHLGKSIHHEYKNSISSTDLSNTKRQEAFVLNMIGACAFATNNIRNIIDSEQGEDILVRKAFTDSLNKGKVDYNLLKLFLGKGSNSNEETLWALRGSIRGIRNNVIHYKKDAIEKIFKIEVFENPINGNDQNETPYSKSIFGKYLQEDISKLSGLFANQLMTGGVLSYYSIDDLKAILDKIEFNLCRSSIPFTPSFKKVFKGGRDYQEKKPSLNLNNYITKEKNHETEEEYQARYFLLKLLYNNIFIPSFEGNYFREAAKYVLEENKNNAL
ncbi:MAG: type VI-A CRISPR-associated RNA-guided ribonuclease Cas13a, partial [Bacteroidales bacterium]